MPAVVNTEQFEAWNGYEGAYWAEHQDRWDAVNTGVNDQLFAAAAIGEQNRVLDVGCGNGLTTRLAARRASRGHAVGIDLSAPMLERARATAAAESIANVTFLQGDAQVHPFPPAGFDVAISRFGVMFFSDPIAAFANIGRALKPGGRLAFVSFRDLSQSDLGAVFGAIAEPAPVLGGDGAETPGMFSLADPARIDEVLTRAGFAGVTPTPIDFPMLFGRDAADAAGFLLGSGPVRDFLAQADQRTVARVTDRLTAVLRPYQEPGGVRLGGAAWLVSASRP